MNLSVRAFHVLAVEPENMKIVEEVEEIHHQYEDRKYTAKHCRKLIPILLKVQFNLLTKKVYRSYYFLYIILETLFRFLFIIFGHYYETII